MGQVLEAMMIGALVIGAVGAAIAFKAPPPPSATAGTQNLAQETWDAVDALNHMHYPDRSFGNSTLAKVVGDAASGNPNPLVDSLENFMPPGSEFQVYLNNGFDRFPLYTNKTPTGQTVGIAYPFEPNWKFHYGDTDLRLYNKNATTPTMGTNLIPLFNSFHLQDSGQYMRVRFAGEQNWLPGDAQGLDRDNFDLRDPEDTVLGENSSVNTIQKNFTEDAYTTLLQGDDTVDYPSAAVYMRCSRSPNPQPCYGMDFTGQMKGYGPMNSVTLNDTESTLDLASGETVTWYRVDIRVENGGPGDVPAGAMLEIRYPVGLPVKQNVSNPGGGFEDIRYTGSHPDPMTVRADLASPLTEGQTATLQTWVRVNDTRYAYKKIDATLGGGAVSSSQFLTVVQEKPWAYSSAGDTRAVLVSAPKPAGSIHDDGTLPTGRWGLILPTPIGPVDLENITVQITERQGHFMEVSYPSDFDPTYQGFLSDSQPMDAGTLSHNATTVRWEGEHRTDGYLFAELQLKITTDGELTQASPEFPFAKPRAKFTGYTPAPQDIQIEPGIWWSEYPPVTGEDTSPTLDDLPGYGQGAPSPSESDPIVKPEAENRIVHRNTPLTGQTPYRLADLGARDHAAMKDAAHFSQLRTNPQRVLPGQQVDMRLNVDDLASYLADKGGVTNMNMTTRVYAPWGIWNLTPSKTYRHFSTSGPIKGPQAVTTAWLDGDQAQDLIVGSSDGTVYGVAGDSGNPLSGHSFPLPGRNDTSTVTEPIIVDRGLIPGTGPVYSIGTTAGNDHWFSLNHDLNERWRAKKADAAAGVATYGLNTSLDITGDGVPEVVASHNAESTKSNATSASRITLWNGVDQDGDGQGDLMPGAWDWSFPSDYGVTVPGNATQLGMGYLGARAKPGVYVNTGLQVSASVTHGFNGTVDAIDDGEPKGAGNISYSASVQGNGLVGYHQDGRRVWNFSGGGFVDLHTTDRMEETGNWSGILAADRQGWLYGFNGSQPIGPVSGWTYVNVANMNDVAMANPLEGYIASSDGILFNTRDGWTTLSYYDSVLDGPGVPEITYPGVKAVDTPDGAPFSGHGNISWWAGDNGLLLRSTDRLETVDELSKTAKLVGTLQLKTSQNELLTQVVGLSKDEVDLSKVDFKDVHAVDAGEAWFVGTGISGTSLEDYGYIVHATDGGDTVEAVRVECHDGGSLLSKCGLNAISDDGERLWIAGENGVVLSQRITGQSSTVEMTGIHSAPGVNANGRLVVNLTSSQAVQVRNVTVDWRPTLRLSWMRGVGLKDGGVHYDLWNKTNGKDYIEDNSTDYSDKGAFRNATLFVKQYVNNVAGHNDSDRTIDGAETLVAGPFRTTLKPNALDPDAYFDQSWYVNENDSLYSDNRPMNFTINVTYEDGSIDYYRVNLLDDGTETWNEIDAIGWRPPSELGFKAPQRCFGMPEKDCTTFHGLNFTQHPNGLTGALVGEPQKNTSSTAPQAAITRLAPGSNTWTRMWDLQVNQTFRDVAINVHDPDHWVVVGDDARVVKSFDTGKNWTDLITPAITGTGVGETLHAVDYTNTHSATIVGGDSPAQLWTLDGYREYGRTRTVNLTREAGSSSGDLEEIAVDPSKMIISSANAGQNDVIIEVWDENKSTWVALHEASSGWDNVDKNDTTSSYNFSAPQQNLRFQITLRTGEAFSRFSSQVRGQLSVDAQTDDDNATDVSYHLDVNDTSQFESLDQLNHSAEHGFLRLPGAKNPWVVKTGNWEAGDWSETASNTTAPRITDMAVSPDGHTAYVTTNGIHDVHTGAQAKASDGKDAYDNSLYRINVSTGQRVKGWGPIHFSEPIWRVEVAQDTLYVVTRWKNATNDPWTIHRVARSDGAKLTNILVASSQDLMDVAIADAFPAVTNSDEDLVLALDSTATKNGRVQAYAAPDLDLGWSSTPSLKGIFDFVYEVPRSALYGSHVVVSEIRWKVTDEHGQDLVQSAKIHNSFAVTPPTKRIPLSPTYNLEVVAWMEDWT